MTTGDVKATAPAARPSFAAMAGIGFAMLLPLAASVIQAGLLIDKLPVEERLSIKESRDADTKAAYTPPDGSISEVIIQRPIRHEVTLNRKLSEASVSEALFRNAGTAPCSITVARPDSDNNPELVMVTMTPQGKGTVQLALTEKPPDNLKSLYDHDVDVGSTEPTGKKRLSVADHVADEFRYHKSWARPKEEVAYQVKFRRPVKTADMKPGIFRNALDDVKNWNPEKPAAEVSVVKIKPDSEPFSDSFTVVMKAEAPKGKERGYARLEIVNDAVLRDSSGTEIPRAGPIQAEQELAISPEEPGTVLAKLELVPPVNVAAVGQKVLAKLTFASSINPAIIAPDQFINKDVSGPDIAVKIDASDEKTVDLSFVCDKPGKVRLGMKRMVIPGPKGFPLEARIEDAKPIDIIEGGLMVKAFNPKKRIIEEGGSVDYQIEFNKPVSTKQFNAEECVSNDRPGKIKVVNVNPAQESKELVIRVTPQPGCKVIYLKISKDSQLQDPNGVKLKMNIDQVDPLAVVVGQTTMLEVVPSSIETILVNAAYRMQVRNLPKEVNLTDEFKTGKIGIINKATRKPIPNDWVNHERGPEEIEWTTEVRPKIAGHYEFIWETPNPIGPVDNKFIVMGRNNYGGKVDVANRWVDPPKVNTIPAGTEIEYRFPGIPENVNVKDDYDKGRIVIYDNITNRPIPRDWGRWVWYKNERRWVWICRPRETTCFRGTFPTDYYDRYGIQNGVFGQTIDVIKTPMYAPKAGKVLVIADTGFLRRDNACNKAVTDMVEQLRAGLINKVLIVDRSGIREWQPIPQPAAEPTPLQKDELFIAYNEVANKLKSWDNKAVNVVLVWCEDGEPNMQGALQINKQSGIFVAFAGRPNNLQGPEIQKKIPPPVRMECARDFEAMAPSIGGILGGVQR